jgi:hypothetical protein
MGGGVGGGHIGGGFGGGHFGGQAFSRGFEGRHSAGMRGHFDHDGRFRRGFVFGPGSDYGYYDYGCGYGYPNYNPYNCYQSTY